MQDLALGGCLLSACLDLAAEQHCGQAHDAQDQSGLGQYTASRCSWRLGD